MTPAIYQPYDVRSEQVCDASFLCFDGFARDQFGKITRFIRPRTRMCFVLHGENSSELEDYLDWEMVNEDDLRVTVSAASEEEAFHMLQHMTHFCPNAVSTLVLFQTLRLRERATEILDERQPDTQLFVSMYDDILSALD